MTEQKIDVQRAFVRFVDNDASIFGERRISLRFGEQHAVRHHFDDGVAAGLIAEADFATDSPAPLDFQFFGDSSRDMSGLIPRSRNLAACSHRLKAADDRFRGVSKIEDLFASGYKSAVLNPDQKLAPFPVYVRRQLLHATAAFMLVIIALGIGII